MKLDKAIISKLEDLAMLRLSKKEREEITSDLEKIVDMIDVVRSVDMDTLETGKTGNQRLRQDVPAESLSVDQVFQNCSNRRGKYFAVPKIIKKKNG